MLLLWKRLIISSNPFWQRKRLLLCKANWCARWEILTKSYSAVMDATQETTHQKIFSFVDDVDPSGGRTIGVMTKCDLVPTAEKDEDAHESVCTWFARKLMITNGTRPSKGPRIKSVC